MVSVHEMLSLDPNTRLADSSSATPTLKVVCPNLVRLDAAMCIQPDLAESWIASDDWRTFTFTLREGLRFHNDRPVDAESIAWNFIRIADSRIGSLLVADYVGLASVRPLSNRVVEFTFERPFPSFLHHLAGRSHICADASIQPIGAGAFQVIDWVRGSHLTLQKFDGYWDRTQPSVDQITVRWAPDAPQRIEMIERGEADLVEALPAGAADSLSERGLMHSASVASGKKLTLAFNCTRPPFSDLRMRLAVAHAVDRDGLIATFLGAHGKRVDAAYARDSEWGTDVEPLDQDLERARRLVREAGFSDGVTVRAIMTNVAPVPKVAAMLGSQLSQIGITLDLRGYDDPPWWPLIYLDTDWDLAFQGMGPRAHPDILFGREFMSGGSFNATGYSNLQLDALVVAARSAIAEIDQKGLYDKVQHIVRAEVPVLILYATDSLVGWKPGIGGFRPHPLGYWSLESVVRA